MLLRERPCDPNDSGRFQTSRIRKQLSKMNMVGPTKLVLYQHPMTRSGVFAENVRPKWANIFLCRLMFKLYTDGLAEKLQIFGLSQPGCKVAIFSRPYLARVDRK